MQIKIAEADAPVSKMRYHVWSMNKKGLATRLAIRQTLLEALDVATSHKGPNVYVYVVRWRGIEHEFLYGFLNKRVHARDLRTDIRRILISGRR